MFVQDIEKILPWIPTFLSICGLVYAVGLNKGEIKRLEKKTDCFDEMRISISSIQTDISWIKEKLKSGKQGRTR